MEQEINLDELKSRIEAAMLLIAAANAELQNELLASAYEKLWETCVSIGS